MPLPGVGGVPPTTDAGTGVPKMPGINGTSGANGATAPGTTPGTGATSGTGSTTQNPMMTSMTDMGGGEQHAQTPGASGVPLPSLSGAAGSGPTGASGASPLSAYMNGGSSSTSAPGLSGVTGSAGPQAMTNPTGYQMGSTPTPAAPHGLTAGTPGMLQAMGQLTGNPNLASQITAAGQKVKSTLQNGSPVNSSSTASTAPGNTSTTTPTQTNQTTPAAENYQGTPLQAVGADPSQNLIGTQINPAQAPNLASANAQAYQSWVNEQNPVYEQALREATQQAAATGSLGSGQLNTGLGSLADTFANQAMAAQTSGNLNALQQDFANQNTNIGQMDQQQGYQQGLQQQGINNAQSQYLDQLQGQQEGVNIGQQEYGAGASTNPTNQLTNEGNTSANQANQTTAATGQNAYANAASQALTGMNAYANSKANSGSAGGPVSNVPVTAPTTDYGSYGQEPNPTANTNTPAAPGGSQVPYQGYTDPNTPYIPAIDPNQDQFASYGS